MNSAARDYRDSAWHDHLALMAERDQEHAELLPPRTCEVVPYATFRWSGLWCKVHNITFRKGETCPYNEKGD